jgi:membrane-associated phospholipid phosphatase
MPTRDPRLARPDLMRSSPHWSTNTLLAALVVMAGAATRAEAQEPPRADDQHFKVDPVTDGTLIVAGAGLTGLEELILSTGEIIPQRPGSTSQLLSFDRIAVTQKVDPNAGTYSTIGLGVGVAIAVVDPLLSGLRDGKDAALVDAVLYAETLSLTLAVTDLTKLAVRRPRPLAYAEQAALDKQYGGASKSPSISSTDADLSFFSGHTATVGSVVATATYLAFIRSPGTWRPWLTLTAGTLLTSWVGYERVRAGAHFPTDVIAGALAGGTIGVLVPHMHRHETDGRSYWVGYAPETGGGRLTLQGVF